MINIDHSTLSRRSFDLSRQQMSSFKSPMHQEHIPLNCIRMYLEFRSDLVARETVIEIDPKNLSAVDWEWEKKLPNNSMHQPKIPDVFEYFVFKHFHFFTFGKLSEN